MHFPYCPRCEADRLAARVFDLDAMAQASARWVRRCALTALGCALFVGLTFDTARTYARPWLAMRLALAAGGLASAAAAVSALRAVSYRLARRGAVRARDAFTAPLGASFRDDQTCERHRLAAGA